MPGTAKRKRIGCQAQQVQHHGKKHYYADGVWIHPYEFRQSCYSDFVPGTYEKTVISRLYQYVRTFLAQNGTTSLSLRRPLCTAPSNWTDFEMISASPSPVINANQATVSPTVFHRSKSRHGSYTSPKSTINISPHPYIKPPPPAAAAFSRPPNPPFTTASNPNKRPLPISTQGSPSSIRRTVDVGTQYSPPSLPSQSLADVPKAKGKRRGASRSPEVPPIPPEPCLEPQMPAQRTSTSDTSTKSNSTSSATLVKHPSAAPSSNQGSSPKRARPTRPLIKPMPVQYENCDVRDLVILISNMLMELVRFNDEIPLKDGRLTRFHSRSPPGISIRDYLQRLTTHATLSPPILLSMVYYIDRLCALYPAFTISSLTVHRFLITSATVASKGLSDSFWTNTNYARVGGVSLKELAMLELEFLWRVEWRIVPKPEVLVDYYRSLVERSEGYQIVDQAGESKAAGIEMSDDNMAAEPPDKFQD